MNDRPVRVPVVDDQELVRDGIASLLGQPGITMVGTAADGKEAIERALTTRPDVVLFDVRMPVMDGVAAVAVPPLPATELTAREIDILRLVAAGSTNRQIAARLYVSEGTVKDHMSRILARLGLRDRTQAALYAKDHGLLWPPKHPGSRRDRGYEGAVTGKPRSSAACASSWSYVTNCSSSWRNDSAVARWMASREPSRGMR